MGYLSVLDMHPLDFEEFCWGLGVGEEALCHARDCFAESRPVIEPVHQRMLSLFHLYLMVGGMPAAVTRFLETDSITEVKKVQDDIVRLYRADISKTSYRALNPSPLHLRERAASRFCRFFT